MKYCNQCGKENLDDATYCSSCGLKINNKNNNNPTLNPLNKKDTITSLKKLALILGVIGGIIGLFPAFTYITYQVLNYFDVLNFFLMPILAIIAALLINKDFKYSGIILIIASIIYVLTGTSYVFSQSFIIIAIG